MTITYDVSRTFRLSGDDDRDLKEIMEAAGFNQADALRFAIQSTKHLMTFASENDPQAVYMEHQNARGRVLFVEKMSPDELMDAMLYVRRQIGAAKFDNMITQGKKTREQELRSEQWFTSARELLASTRDPPYTVDEICQTIKNVGGCSLPYTKKVFERFFREGKMVQVSIGKYQFVVDGKKEVVK